MANSGFRVVALPPTAPGLLDFRQRFGQAECRMAAHELALHARQETAAEYVCAKVDDEIVACMRIIDWSTGLTYLQAAAGFSLEELGAAPRIELSRLLVSPSFRRLDVTLTFLRGVARFVLVNRTARRFVAYGGKAHARLYRLAGAEATGHTFTAARAGQVEKFWVFSGQVIDAAGLAATPSLLVDVEGRI